MTIIEAAKSLDEVMASRYSVWMDELVAVEKEVKELDAILQEKESKVDRSENATFQIAKDTRDVKINAMAVINNKLALYSQYQESYEPTGVVTIGSTVELNVKSINGASTTDPRGHRIIKLVAEGLGDAINNLVDVTSATGKALLGCTSGDMFTIKTRKGLIEYAIERMY